MSPVSVGPYLLTLPDFWVGGELREKPGFFGYNAIAVEGVSFAFNVIVGRGDDAEERQRIVDAMAAGYAPERHLTNQSKFLGVPFEGHRFEETKPLGPGSIYELHLTSAYGDLLLLGFGFVAPLAQESSLRHLFLTLVNGAIVQRGYARDRG